MDNEDLISKLDWDDLVDKEDRAHSMGRMMDEPEEEDERDS